MDRKADNLAASVNIPDIDATKGASTEDSLSAVQPYDGERTCLVDFLLEMRNSVTVIQAVDVESSKDVSNRDVLAVWRHAGRSATHRISSAQKQKAKNISYRGPATGILRTSPHRWVSNMLWKI